MTEDGSTVDTSGEDAWKGYWDSNGTFAFMPDPDQSDNFARNVATVYTGQNRLIGAIAAAVDAEFPPEEYGQGHGTGHTSPGDVVRQFLIADPHQAAEEVTRGQSRSEDD